MFVTLPPCRYSRISHPLKKYIGMLNRRYKEKLFLMKIGNRDDPKPITRGWKTLTLKKGYEIAFLTKYL